MFLTASCRRGNGKVSVAQMRLGQRAVRELDSLRDFGEYKWLYNTNVHM